MSSNHRILIKPKAYEDLENIYLYSFKEFGYKRAEKYIQDLNKAFFKLAANPNLGKDCSVVRAFIKVYKSSSHLIFYKVNLNKIIIIRVLHKSMNHEFYLE